MSRFSQADGIWMQRALRLADRVKGSTHPNPAVGAVVIRNEKVVGQGATSYCGGPHAERHALKEAGSRARGATLYVTLEPCCHFGRTPPCTDAIIEAGIGRVVVAIKDVNPLVKNKGIARLRRRGILVQTGLLRDEAYRINEDYFWSIIHRSSWVTLKLAMTLDGRIADHSGRSKWITSKETRTWVHELRRKHAGIAVGAGTLRTDNPELTVRHVTGCSPVRFVISSGATIPRNLRFFDTADQVRSVLVKITSGNRVERVSKKGAVEVWKTGEAERVEGMRRFLRMAYEEGVSSILFEGGAQLASFMLENRFVNRLYLCYGNKIVGKGLEGIRFTEGVSLQDAYELKERLVQAIGADVIIGGVLPREE